MEENRVNLTKEEKNVDKKAVIFKTIVDVLKYFGLSVFLLFVLLGIPVLTVYGNKTVLTIIASILVLGLLVVSGLLIIISCYQSNLAKAEHDEFIKELSKSLIVNFEIEEDKDI